MLRRFGRKQVVYRKIPTWPIKNLDLSSITSCFNNSNKKTSRIHQILLGFHDAKQKVVEAEKSLAANNRKLPKKLGCSATLQNCTIICFEKIEVAIKAVPAVDSVNDNHSCGTTMTSSIKHNFFLHQNY